MQGLGPRPELALSDSNANTKKGESPKVRGSFFGSL